MVEEFKTKKSVSIKSETDFLVFLKQKPRLLRNETGFSSVVSTYLISGN